MSSGWEIAIVLIGALVAIELALMIALLRTVAYLHQSVTKMMEHRQRGVRAGLQMPDVAFSELFSGDQRHIEALWQARGLVIIFVSVGCVSCRNVLQRVTRIASAVTLDSVPVVVLAAGNAPILRYFAEDMGIRKSGGPIIMGLVDQPRVESLGVVGTPTTLRIETRGVVSRALLGEIADDQIREALAAGDVAPAAGAAVRAAD